MMLAVSASSSLFSVCSAPTLRTPSPPLAFGNVHLQSRVTPTSILKLGALKMQRSTIRRMRMVKAVEEETQIPQQQDPQEELSTSEQQTVVVPVSPSDTLTMFFQVPLVLPRRIGVCYNAHVKTLD